MSQPVTAAFVLGAGLGTRLRPLTDDRPKPLVPIFHKPLITFAFDHLRAVGVSRFVVNTHHRPEAYDKILGASGQRATYAGLPVAFRHEPVLLDTGGGIRNIEDLIQGESFLVHNGDVLADLPLQRLIDEHVRSGHVATLGLRSFGGPTHIQFDPATRQVTDIRHTLGAASAPSFLFTGIYLLSPEIFRFLPPRGEISSIIATFLDLLRRGEKIGGAVLDEGLWFDLGTRSSYFEAHRLFADGQTALSYPLDRPWPQAVDSSAVISSTVTMEGLCAVGPRAEISSGARLRDCIIWEDAKIAPSASLETCIVRDGRHGEGILRDADV